MGTDEAMDIAQVGIVDGRSEGEIVADLIIEHGLDDGEAVRIYKATATHPVTKQLVAHRPKLTTDDLDAALNDEDHLGWGYSGASSYLSDSKRERLDRAVVAVANELGLSKRELFHWTNSKYGRWLTDTVESPSKASVREYLNADAMQVLKEGR